MHSAPSTHFRNPRGKCLHKFPNRVDHVFAHQFALFVKRLLDCAVIRFVFELALWVLPVKTLGCNLFVWVWGFSFGTVVRLRGNNGIFHFSGCCWGFCKGFSLKTKNHLGEYPSGFCVVFISNILQLFLDSRATHWRNRQIFVFPRHPKVAQ